jgi:hypothetical protein
MPSRKDVERWRRGFVRLLKMAAAADQLRSAALGLFWIVTLILAAIAAASVQVRDLPLYAVILGGLATIVGCLLLLHVVLELWPRLRQRVAAPQLAFESPRDVLMDNFNAVYDAIPGGPLRLFPFGSFYGVEVRNESGTLRSLQNVLAKIEYPDGRIETGLWSAKAGSRFEPGGDRRVEIGYGDCRVLVLALYGEVPGPRPIGPPTRWLSFSYEDFPPALTGTDAGVKNRAMDGVRPAHRFLGDFGPECEITARFTGDGLSQEASWRLYLEDGRPMSELIRAY